MGLNSRLYSLTILVSHVKQRVYDITGFCPVYALLFQMIAELLPNLQKALFRALGGVCGRG